MTPSVKCVWPLVMLLVVLSGCRDVCQSSYATHKAAEQDGSVSRGWMPKNLPSSSRDIYEKHSIDSNWCHGSFRFGTNDASSWRKELTAVSSKNLGRMRIAVRREWPHAISRSPSIQDLEKEGFELYVAEPFVFAVDFDSGFAYYWLQKPSKID